MKFISGKQTILVDNDEAEGKENWKTYGGGQFKAYNQIGKTTYHDENARKGELALRYHPSVKKDEFSKITYYHLPVGYPAKQDHAIR